MIWHRVEHTFYLSFLEANMQKPRWVFWQTLILRSVLLTKTYAGVWFSRWWMHFIQAGVPLFTPAFIDAFDIDQNNGKTRHGVEHAGRR